MQKLLLSLVGLLLIAAGVSAASLYADADFVSVSCTRGQVFFWVENKQAGDVTVSLSAELGDFNGAFTDAFGTAESYGSFGTELNFYAPDCARGMKVIPVKARVCGADGSCETLSRELSVSIKPCGYCDYALNYSDGQIYYGSSDYGEGSQRTSTLASSKWFDPTQYAVDFTGSNQCVSIKSGGFDRVPVHLGNKGATGSFDLELSGDYQAVGAMLSSSRVSLDRGTGETVYLDVYPGETQGGKYWVTVQALHDDYVVSESDYCIIVEDTFAAQASVPSIVNTNACTDFVYFPVKVENTGTGFDDYFASVEHGAVAPEKLGVQAGESGEFQASVRVSELEIGVNEVSVNVNGGRNGKIGGQALVKVVVEGCPGKEKPIEVESKQDGDLYRIVVKVSNDGSQELKGVHAEITGIPSSWSVDTAPLSIIPAGETRDVVLWMKRSSDEEADPVVVIKDANENVLGTAELPEIAQRQSGLTGMIVAAASQNFWLIAALVVAAFFMIFAYSRGGRSQRYDGTEQYKERLQKIKDSI